MILFEFNNIDRMKTQLAMCASIPQNERESAMSSCIRKKEKDIAQPIACQSIQLIRVEIYRVDSRR